MFWNDPSLEVKKSFQWQGYIDFKDKDGRSLGLKTSPFLVSSWTKPTLNFSNDEIISKLENDITYRVKSAGWAPITVTILETMNKETNATSNLFLWLRSNGYNAQSLANAANDSDAQNFITNIGSGQSQADLSLTSLDPEGKEYERWRFLNPTVMSIDFGGTLDYSKAEMLQVTIRFNYSAADYELINDISLPPLEPRPPEGEVQVPELTPR